MTYQDQSTPVAKRDVYVEMGWQLILAFHSESPKRHSRYHSEAARPPGDQIQCSPLSSAPRRQLINLQEEIKLCVCWLDQTGLYSPVKTPTKANHNEPILLISHVKHCPIDHR